MILLELGVVFLLMVLNGVFAMSELAIVSSRRPRLTGMAEAGDRGAATALALKDDPSRFLSTVQIGITLIGILSGAFSGATLAHKLGVWFDTFPAIAPHGQTAALAVVVVAITYGSLVIGELVPKRLALVHANAIAARIARPLSLLSTLGRPLVILLGLSTTAVLRLLGVRQETAPAVTAEEVRTVIAEGTEAGIIDPAEKEMVSRLLRLADRSVAGIMTPRREVMWIDLADDPASLREDLRKSPYSRLVVAREGELDEPLGIVQKKDLLDRLLAGGELDVAAAVREPLFLPDSASVVDALEAMKKAPVHIAFVVDEFGYFEGLLTLTDIIEAIAGGLADEHGEPSAGIVQRADGSYLVDGSTTVGEIEATLGLHLETRGRFHTVAGLVLDRLARLPKEGDLVEIEGWHIEVVDTDLGGRRIDKVLFSRLAP
jgi:putative hemolysin